MQHRLKYPLGKILQKIGSITILLCEYIYPQFWLYKPSIYMYRERESNILIYTRRVLNVHSTTLVCNK